MSGQKQLTLKLRSVSYSGDNIGKEFTFEITADSVTKTIRRNVIHGTTATISRTDSIILTKEVEASIIGLPVGIKVTEDDPITDDVAVIPDASGTGTLPFVPVDYEAIGIQFHSLSVSVEEVGVFTSSKTATLTFNFEVDLQEIGTRFVFNVSERGWLSIRHEDELTSPKVLPYALKVKITEVKDGREYFIIEEGRLKGHKASVKLADDDGSFLTKENLHTDSVNFIYHQENMV